MKPPAHLSIVTGSEEEANCSKSKGWVVGHFMREGIARTPGLEIKIWNYPTPFDYGTKEFLGTEFIIVYGGVLLLELEASGDDPSANQIFELTGAKREYIIIPPSFKKKVGVKEGPTYGICVRWPSNAEANKVVQ